PCTSADDLRHTGLHATEPKFATISRRFTDALVPRAYPASISRNSGMARMSAARRGRHDTVGNYTSALHGRRDTVGTSRTHGCAVMMAVRERRGLRTTRPRTTRPKEDEPWHRSPSWPVRTVLRNHCGRSTGPRGKRP